MGKTAEVSGWAAWGRLAEDIETSTGSSTELVVRQPSCREERVWVLVQREKKGKLWLL